MKNIEIKSLNISKEKGTIKRPVRQIKIDQKGIEGDAHAGNWHRQVSLLAYESIEKFSLQENKKFSPGDFAENITTTNLDYEKISLLDQIKINECKLEVTQIGKKCHGGGCAVFQEVGKCVMPKEGIFCRVIDKGTAEVGDKASLIPRYLQFEVITLSDRASSGEYEDFSGPKITSILNEYFYSTRWRVQIKNRIIPDNKEILQNTILAAKEKEVDVIFTTGGTGIGPRDITPDIVAPMCDKILPGIMGHIRIKYGCQKPNALLTRGIAGVINKSLIYTLPGSVKAVTEYTNEILKTTEHAILMLHGVGH